MVESSRTHQDAGPGSFETMGVGVGPKWETLGRWAGLALLRSGTAAPVW